MGIIRDAAIEIVKDMMIVGGASAFAGAGTAIDKMQEKANARKEARVNFLFKAKSFVSKYKHSMLAICAEHEGSRTYVFSTPDNQIKYMTSRPFGIPAIYLHDFDEKVIGSVGFGIAMKSGFIVGKKYIRTLTLNIAGSQIGTVEIAVSNGAKSIKLHTYFWDIWIKNNDSIIESEKEFKMAPIDKLAKKAYQIDYDDPGKEAILALTLIALKEAKRILKEEKL